jgi:4-diphosphocytidyl-2-C-methyl-D-erythritol kinase
MNSLTLDSPAKINLMLSVHGPRGDGFHALTSLVVALQFGDTLRVSRNGVGAERLRCTDVAVPTGEANLILKASAVFRATTGWTEHFDFDLEKRIPMGAGLGGGSSNAAVALRAMNKLAGSPLQRDDLLRLAAGLGSDCPFFIDSVPSVMTGRGEVLDPLPERLAAELHGQGIVLFRPEFGIETAWAYRRLQEAGPSSYEAETTAVARLEGFARSGQLAEVLHNSFEPRVGAKYLAIPCLLEELRSAGHACLMSGSGSCCFALVRDAMEARAIRALCETAWGPGIFFIETSVL